MSNKTKLDLFHRINDHEAMQGFMDELCDRLQDVISCMSFYSAVYKDSRKNSFCSPCDTFDIPEPWEFRRNEEKTLHLKTFPNFKDSGSVMPCDVRAVLKEGNVRERAYQILTTFCREKRANILKWVLFTRNENMPQFLNLKVIKSFRSIIKDMPQEFDADQKINALKKKLFIVSEKRQRLRRSQEDILTGNFGIKEEMVVPEISEREKRVILKTREQGDSTLPWVTGRQQWVLSEYMKNSLKRHNPNHEVISGLSGHTECMIVLMRIFTCFDIRKITLMCVLWLAPCEHHSIFEVFIVAYCFAYTMENTDKRDKQVLYTAKMHGLRYNLTQNPISFCHKLLDVM